MNSLPKSHFMKIRCLLQAAAVVALVSLHAQEVDNINFAKGKTGWLGDGKEVYVDAAGAVSETQTPGSTPAIKIELSKNSWKSLTQKLRPKSKETDIKFAISVKADTDYVPLAESKEYSNSDWKMGGEYVWSAEVYPKCDFLVRVKDETWYYRPVKLVPGTWKKCSVNFPGLKGRQREVELLFPPGEGTVYLKGS